VDFFNIFRYISARQSFLIIVVMMTIIIMATLIT